MKKAVLKLENISKSFLNVNALSDITMEFYPGKVNALIGSNGAGKTTLIKVIAGLVPITGGALYLDGEPVCWTSPYNAQKAGVAICTQEIQVFNELSVQENILVGNAEYEKKHLQYKEKQELVQTILKRLSLNIAPQQKVKYLSLAEKFLIQFGRTLALNPKVLILDELTAVLTQVECERVYKIIEELKQQHISIIIVTHKIEEAVRIADDITVLRDGRVIDIIRAVDVRNGMLENEILGQDRKQYFPKLPVKKGEVLLQVHNISNKFLDDISFSLRRGEILGVAGLVGSGRSSLLRAIVGLDKVDNGEVIITDKRGSQFIKEIHDSVGFMPENRDTNGLFLNMPIIQNITIKNLKKVSRFHFIQKKKEKLDGCDAMDRLGIDWHSLDSPISYLSGGNKQKLLIARNVYSKCSIYVFDEPTRGVDTAGKVEIYNIINELARKGAGIILVSSDFSELAGMCDRLLAIKKGRISVVLTQEETTQLRLYTIFKDA